jgi:hypothetical protein
VFCIVEFSFSDLHTLYADPDPDTTFLTNANPDPIPDSFPHLGLKLENLFQSEFFKIFHQIKSHFNNLYKWHSLKYAVLH